MNIVLKTTENCEIYENAELTVGKEKYYGERFLINKEPIKINGVSHFENHNNKFNYDDLFSIVFENIPDNVSFRFYMKEDFDSSIASKIPKPYQEIELFRKNGESHLSYYILEREFASFYKKYSIESYKDYISKLIADNNKIHIENGYKGVQIKFEVDERSAIREIFQETLLKLNELNDDVERLMAGLDSFYNVLKSWNENKVIEKSKEDYWQNLFSEYSEVLGLLFSTPVVYLKEKPFLGGKSLFGRGGKHGDFSYLNPLNNTITLVEIKTPGTRLIGKESLYRAGVYEMSGNLTGSINQLIVQREKLTESFPAIQKETEEQHGIKIEYVSPRSLLIIGSFDEFLNMGRTSDDTKSKQKELENKNKWRNFERFRSELRSIDVITFDEVFEKVKLFSPR
ncbi:DUF4263 domain-containing protein [Bacillus thuringiensis]